MSRKIAKAAAHISNTHGEAELIAYLDTLDISFLHKLNEYLSIKYYEGESPVSDDQYDMVKDQLETLTGEPAPVGAPVEKSVEVTLPYWMASMAKLKATPAFLQFRRSRIEEAPESQKESEEARSNLEKGLLREWQAFSDLEREKWRKDVEEQERMELDKWLSKNKSSQYIIEDKLDGVSCLLVVKNGIHKLYTRGTGSTGKDISRFARYFAIPKNLEDMVVRGELVIPLDKFFRKFAKIPPTNPRFLSLFQTPSTQRNYKSPRNFITGLLGRKTPIEATHAIEFVAYELITPNQEQPPPSAQFEYLSNLEFRVVWYKLVPKISLGLLEDIYLVGNESRNYLMDGLIIQPNKSYQRVRHGEKYPSYAIAFKMDVEEKLALVTGVEWNVGKRGRIAPKIHYEPLTLDYVTVSKASVYHAKFVKENKLGPGSQIMIVRSGGVIPKISKVIKPATSGEAQMPNFDFEWDFDFNWEVDTDKEPPVNIWSTDKSKDWLQCIKLLTNFFIELDIKKVKEQTIKKLYKAGYDTLIKILLIKKPSELEAKGFGPKESENIVNNIQAKLHQGERLSTILGATGVFGSKIGGKTTRALFDKFPNILVDQRDMSKAEKISTLRHVDGFGEVLAKTAASNLKYADKMAQFFMLIGTFNVVAEPQGESMAGETVVFSGGRPKELIAFVEANGGTVGDRVTKNTTILVVKDMSKGQSKQRTAEKLNAEKSRQIVIISQPAFKNNYMS